MHHRQAEELLAGLSVIVDGTLPVVQPLCGALRRLGIGRVEHGGYAAEPGLLTGPVGADRCDGRTDRTAAGPSAVVFVSDSPVSPALGAPWHHRGVIQLPVVMGPDTAIVGPLVLPGVSSCLRCHDLLAHARPGPGELEPHEADRAGTPDPAIGLFATALVALTLRQSLLGDHALAGISSEIRSGRPDVVHRHWPRQGDCCGARPSPGVARVGPVGGTMAG